MHMLGSFLVSNMLFEVEPSLTHPGRKTYPTSLDLQQGLKRPALDMSYVDVHLTAANQYLSSVY
jgi:hypothetical protein